MAEKHDHESEDADRKHPAGPHAKPELTNKDATPGTGSLPEATDDSDAEGGTG